MVSKPILPTNSVRTVSTIDANSTPPNTGKTCIIGAGCSGFSMAKRLKDAGLQYDCFEMSDNIGGNWYYKNPNGLSSCYESLHIDTSKWRLAFEDFPVPEDWPDFPHHSQLFDYFNDYVDHFGLRDSIVFNTSVTQVQRTDTGEWAVSLSNGESRVYQWLVVANGHHWDPNMPHYPGLEDFGGYQVHSHHYREPFEPYDFRGKKVLVIGAGNSAMDIASELSQRTIASRLFISMRRGVWVLPKYMKGEPADKAVLPSWLPTSIGRALARRVIKTELGNPEDYGLPKPDHEPLDAHPSVSGEFLTRVGCGDILPRGAIDRFESGKVIFADGTNETIDAIIWATGYRVSFPFLNEPDLTPKDNRLPLFKRMVRPGYNNLFFLGLAQPLPTLVNFAEQQSKLVAAAIQGDYVLPGANDMQQVIEADERKHMGHFYAAARHTMQVDFNVYCKDLMKEVERGRARQRNTA
ncbi:MAG: NAD(P)-binding domain-containing protein [Halioglobus sp.]